MPKLHLSWSDGRYTTRHLSDEESAAYEAAGCDVVYLEDQVYAAYVRDCARDSIWQTFWRALSNEQSVRRREKALMPLEDAEREITRLKVELATAKRLERYYKIPRSRYDARPQSHMPSYTSRRCQSLRLSMAPA
jgi:hypothetical protein